MTSELDMIRHMDRARQLRSEAMQALVGRLLASLVHRLRRILRLSPGWVAQPTKENRTDTPAGR